MPKTFRMTKDGKLIEGIFEGDTINNPGSMLAVTRRGLPRHADNGPTALSGEGSHALGGRGPTDISRCCANWK
jgi:hypothetical protein